MLGDTRPVMKTHAIDTGFVRIDLNLEHESKQEVIESKSKRLL
jgi:hypothetical protein